MIRLVEDFAMVADDHCYIVGKLRKSRGKGEELRDPTYHSSVSQAVSAALDRAMRYAVKEGQVTTLRQFIQEQERLELKLQELLAPLRGGECPEKAGGSA